jgi:hypothetical protein
MQPDVQVEGIPETLLSIQRVAGDLDDLNVPAAEQMILVAAQARAPRKTGRLAASGRHGNAPRIVSVTFGSPQVPYANAIHWGWRKHNISPRPFLMDAIEQTEPLWLRAMDADLQRRIDRDTK